MIRGLLLCGGNSSRFGSDKLLHRHARAGENPVPLAVRSARNLIAGGARVLAVIPYGATPLAKLLEAEGCEILESKRTARGLGASLAAGVEATPDAHGWLVALGDMPFIEPKTIAAVLGKLEEGALLAAPVLPAGQRGHPVGFGRALRDELVALDRDEGARSVIAAHRADLVLVPVDDPGIVKDIDRPSDLEREGGRRRG